MLFPGTPNPTFLDFAENMHSATSQQRDVLFPSSRTHAHPYAHRKCIKRTSSSSRRKGRQKSPVPRTGLNGFCSHRHCFAKKNTDVRERAPVGFAQYQRRRGREDAFFRHREEALHWLPRLRVAGYGRAFGPVLRIPNGACRPGPGLARSRKSASSRGHSHVDADTHLLLPACLCGWVAAHSHSRTGALDCVTVWTQRVKECVTMTMSLCQRTQSQSPPSLCGCVALIVHTTRSHSHSLSHAQIVRTRK